MIAAILPLLAPAQPAGTGAPVGVTAGVPVDDEPTVVLVTTDEVRAPELVRALRELCGAEGVELVLGAPAETPDAGPGRYVIAPRDRARVEERELARAVRAASSIHLRGGRFMEWYDTLLPKHGPARLAYALFDAYRADAPVVAYGPAASFLAGAGMVPRSEIGEPQRNPRDIRPYLALIGLGYGPPAIVDAEGWPVGDPLELLIALGETKVDLGIFLAGEVALVYEHVPRRARLLGPGSALVLDLDGARRNKRSVRGARASVLRAGDAWEVEAERLAPDAGRRAAADRAPGDEQLAELATRLGFHRDGPQAPWKQGVHTLELRCDERTQLLVDEAGRATPAGVVFDWYREP